MSRDRDTLGFLIADLFRQMRHTFGQRLEGSALTLAQARVLVYVSQHEGVRQVELAELLEVQPMTLARSIDQLAAEGLVERRADPDDRRAYRIHLTRAARPHLAAIENVAASIRAQAMRGLTAAEASAAQSVLRHMRDNLAGPTPAPRAPADTPAQPVRKSRAVKKDKTMSRTRPMSAS